MTITPGCPDVNRLQALLDGSLSEEDQGTLADHLSGCDSCRRKLDEIGQRLNFISEAVRDQIRVNTAQDDALQDMINTLRAEGPQPVGRGGATENLTQSPNATIADVSLDFLQPSDNARHLGKLGPYQITEVVGRGGMGVVLKGFDPSLTRHVAIKVLSPQLASNGAARARFLREARAAAAISHDHVVTIHAVDESAGLPFLVMEYVSGRSLEMRIKKTGPLRIEEILRIGMQTASGLAAAHAQGLVHRDVKPSNILLENGVERVKITDFGLAKAVDDVRITQTGMVTGTPEYMSPEQARGGPVDHRSDVFSLGCVLYAMCTGRSPFRANSVVDAIRRVCDDTPRPVQDVNPSIPGWLVDIINSMLAKSPDERIQSAAEVANLLGRMLTQFQQGLVEPPRSISPVPKRSRRPTGGIGRRFAPFAYVALLLVAGVAIAEVTGVTNLHQLVVTHFQTPYGEVVVRITEPEIKVDITKDGEVITLTGLGDHLIELRPGRHPFQATKDGMAVKSDWISVTRGDKQVVTIGPSSPQGRSAGANTGTLVVKLAYGKPDGDFPYHVTVKGLDYEQVFGKRGNYSVDLRPGVYNVEIRANDTNQVLRSGTVRVATGSALQIVCHGGSSTRVPMQPQPTPMAEFVGHHGTVRRVVFSPDGSTAVTVSDDKTTCIWSCDGQRWHQTHACSTPAANATCLAYSKSGAQFVSGGVDGTIRIWDSTKGNVLNTLPGNNRRFLAVAFCNQERAILTVSPHAIETWNIESRRKTKSLDTIDSPIACATVSPDGQTLATGHNDGVLRLWNMDTLELGGALRGHSEWITSVDFSGDGSHLASGSADSTIRLWDVAAQETTRVLNGHYRQVACVAFSPRSNILASAGSNQEIRFWGAESGELLKEFNADWANITDLAFSIDGQTLAAAGDSYNTRLWEVPAVSQRTDSEPNLAKPRLEERFFFDGNMYWFAFSPDGSRVAVYGRRPESDAVVRVWQLEDMIEVATLPIGENPGFGYVEFLPNGNEILASQKNALALWNVDATVPEGTLPHKRQYSIFDVSKDGRAMVSVHVDDTLLVWDLESHKFVKTAKSPGGRLFSVAIHPDGRRVAAAGERGTVFVWDLDDLDKEPERYEHGGGPIWRLAYSPDGKTLASCSGSVVKLWTPGSHEASETIETGLKIVCTAAFSADGHVLAISGDDASEADDRSALSNRILLRDLAKDRTLAEFSSHVKGVTQLEFSSTGKLGVLSSGKAVSIWDVTEVLDGVAL